MRRTIERGSVQGWARSAASIVASIACAAACARSAAAQCAAWFGVGDANTPLTIFEEFDEDGGGPLPPALFAAGPFVTMVGGANANRIARYREGVWSRVGTMTPGGGFGGTPRAMVVFDDDGPGPHGPALYLGGASLTSIDGVPVNGIAKWDGAAWSPVGPVDPGAVPVWSLCVFDEDGPGSGLPALVAGGTFASIGGTSALRVARWNGVTWSAMGAGLGALPTALAVLDEDGDGPATPTLYAGMANPPALTAWNGATWSAAPNQPPMARGSALVSHDDDGPGPAPGALYCANLVRANNTVSIAARPASGAWTSLASYSSNNADTLGSISVYDADGEGAGRGRLLAGFSHDAALPGLHQYDGAFWTPIPGLPMAAEAQALASRSWRDSTEIEAAPPALFVGFGDPLPSGPMAGQILGVLRFGASALTLDTPASVSASVGGSAVFSTTVDAGSAVHGFRWRRNGLRIYDGGNVSGAATDTLTIEPVSVLDAGVYECEAATSCASALSGAAFLRVDECPEDTNGDSVIDFLDLNGVLSLFGLPCP